MINKYPYEIETPLDRRAMTIDILAGELERKNRTIKAWRIKFDESENQCWKEKHDKLQVQFKKITRRYKSAKMGSENMYEELQSYRKTANGKANGNLESDK